MIKMFALSMLLFWMCACNSEVKFMLYVSNQSSRPLEIVFVHPITGDSVADGYRVSVTGEDSLNLRLRVLIMPDQKELVRIIYTEKDNPASAPVLLFDTYVDGERVGARQPGESAAADRISLHTIKRHPEGSYTLVLDDSFVRPARAIEITGEGAALDRYEPAG